MWDTYTLYLRGQQIDIDTVTSWYAVDEFGETAIMLYRTVNGAEQHVACFMVHGL